MSAGRRKSRWLFLKGREAVVQSTFPFMTRIPSSQQELVLLLSAIAKEGRGGWEQNSVRKSQSNEAFNHHSNYILLRAYGWSPVMNHKLKDYSSLHFSR